MDASCCLKCGRKISRDEIGIYRKLVNRGADSFLCISCLAAKFEVSEESLHEKIEYYRKQGCTLFV